MELHEIRYFLAVAQSRSFTRAAQACHVSQPALTRAVRKLEAEFGGVLVVRERGNVHLTGLGHLLEPSLRDLMANATEARLAAERYLRLDRAQVRLGVTSSVGPARFTAFLERFRVAWPGIEMSIVQDPSDVLKASLRDGEIDVAILVDAQRGAAPFEALPLYCEPYLIACARSHPFAGRSEIALSELAGQIWVHRIGCEARDRLLGLPSNTSVEVMLAHRSERDDWLQSMAAAGMGICVLPAFSAPIPGVSRVPLSDSTAMRHVSAVANAERERSPAVRRLLAAMAAHAWTAESVLAQ